MDTHLQRALVLLGQARFDLAEKEWRLALAEDPDNSMAHAYLAICLDHRGQDAEATEEARAAIHLDPEWPVAHAVLGAILSGRKRFDEAELSYREALRLDPGEATNYSNLASVLLDQRKWSEALAAAEKGLELDAEHVGCNNFRAMALTKLGRTEEANATIASTLARDPEDPFSHANQGWNYLHQGKTTKALEHFREALRLDPGLDGARAGLVEALKSRNWIYWLMLRYFLFMSKLGHGAQWAVVLGAWLGYQGLRILAENNPDWGPYLWPILIAYIVFALLSWVAMPLFNLLLRLNKYGRYALSRDQIVAANWLGMVLAIALATLAGWVATREILLLLGAMYFGLLLLPVAATFACESGWPRRWMTAYTLLVAVAGPSSFFLFMAGSHDLSELALWAFASGCLLSGFVGNALQMATVRR